MKTFGIIGALVLFPYFLVEAAALWKNDLPEISIFNRKINLKKIFRIDREMLGAHRKPYGAFRLLLVSGMLLVVIGAVFNNILFNLGFIISGLSLLVYGTYGVIKREVCEVTGTRVYGFEAILTGLLIILGGVILIATGIHFQKP